jgi:hypothetical protein
MTNLDSLSRDDLLMKRKGLRRQLSAQACLQETRLAVLGGLFPYMLLFLPDVKLPCILARKAAGPKVAQG